MFLAGGPADEIAPAARADAGPHRPARSRTGTRARRCCGSWSRPSASTRSRRRSSRCWPRFTAPGRRAASWPSYSTLGLLKLRLGALPEADAAARVALRVLQEGDFAPGLAFAATVLADVAVEAGELDEAQALLDLLPQAGWPPGVGTVLIPAARGRLRLAQGRPAEALADFETCLALFGADACGACRPARPVTCTRAQAPRSRCCGSASATARASWPRPSWPTCACFGAPRALGVALRVAGLARGGDAGLGLLGESVAALRGSPALLERAHSLAELGAALRRSGRTRRRARAARRGARPRRPLRRPTAGRARRARSSRPPAPARDARGAPAWRR